MNTLEKKFSLISKLERLDDIIKECSVTDLQEIFIQLLIEGCSFEYLEKVRIHLPDLNFGNEYRTSIKQPNNIQDPCEFVRLYIQYFDLINHNKRFNITDIIDQYQYYKRFNTTDIIDQCLYSKILNSFDINTLAILPYNEEVYDNMIKYYVQKNPYKSKYLSVKYLNIKDVKKIPIKLGNINPLLWACCNKKFELIKYLVEHGADVNRLSTNSTNSIMFCFQNGDAKSYKYLLKKGAKLKIGEESIGYYCPSKEKLTEFLMDLQLIDESN